MVLSVLGAPLERGRADYTDDGRFWDGDLLYRPLGHKVGTGQAAALAAAVRAVELPMTCCPGEVDCSPKRPVPEAGLRRLQQAGYVRFRQPEGHLELWSAEDGTVLALLVGEVVRPTLA